MHTYMPNTYTQTSYLHQNAYTHMHTHTYVLEWKRIHILFKCPQTQTHIPACTCKRTHTYIALHSNSDSSPISHTCTKHTYLHTHANTGAHTHIHTQQRLQTHPSQKRLLRPPSLSCKKLWRGIPPFWKDYWYTCRVHAMNVGD